MGLRFRFCEGQLDPSRSVSAYSKLVCFEHNLLWSELNRTAIYGSKIDYSDRLLTAKDCSTALCAAKQQEPMKPRGARTDGTVQGRFGLLTPQLKQEVRCMSPEEEIHEEKSLVVVVRVFG